MPTSPVFREGVGDATQSHTNLTTTHHHTWRLAHMMVGVNTANGPALFAEKVATDGQVTACVGLHVGQQGNPRHCTPTSCVIRLELASLATAYVFATHGGRECRVDARVPADASLGVP